MSFLCEFHYQKFKQLKKHLNTHNNENIDPAMDLETQAVISLGKGKKYITNLHTILKMNNKEVGLQMHMNHKMLIALSK